MGDPLFSPASRTTPTRDKPLMIRFAAERPAEEAPSPDQGRHNEARRLNLAGETSVLARINDVGAAAENDERGPNS
jgi:hypothetical protein